MYSCLMLGEQKSILNDKDFHYVILINLSEKIMQNIRQRGNNVIFYYDPSSNPILAFNNNYYTLIYTKSSDHVCPATNRAQTIINHQHYKTFEQII